VMGTGGTQGT
jgi:hypothetical protein